MMSDERNAMNWQVGDRVLDSGGKHQTFGVIDRLIPPDPDRIDMLHEPCVVVKYDDPKMSGCTRCVFMAADTRLDRIRRADER